MVQERNAKEVIARAMAYDISDVMERYAEETRLPPDALKEHEPEIKRFLALSSLVFAESPSWVAVQCIRSRIHQ